MVLVARGMFSLTASLQQTADDTARSVSATAREVSRAISEIGQGMNP